MLILLLLFLVSLASIAAVVAGATMVWLARPGTAVRGRCDVAAGTRRRASYDKRFAGVRPRAESSRSDPRKPAAATPAHARRVLRHAARPHRAGLPADPAPEDICTATARPAAGPRSDRARRHAAGLAQRRRGAGPPRNAGTIRHRARRPQRKAAGRSRRRAAQPGHRVELGRPARTMDRAGRADVCQRPGLPTAPPDERGSPMRRLLEAPPRHRSTGNLPVRGDGPVGPEAVAPGSAPPAAFRPLFPD